MPPSNFPNGCQPIYVDSFKNSIIEARKLTTGGILIIGARNDIAFTKTLSQMKEQWQVSEFISKGDYQHLKDCKVLLANYPTVNGFEWHTVIVISQIPMNKLSFYAVNSHESNLFMRCTTNLIILECPYIYV